MEWAWFFVAISAGRRKVPLKEFEVLLVSYLHPEGLRGPLKGRPFRRHCWLRGAGRRDVEPRVVVAIPCGCVCGSTVFCCVDACVVQWLQAVSGPGALAAQAWRFDHGVV